MERKDWELVFTNSTLYGGVYNDTNVPSHKIAWPQDTWLRRRMREKKRQELDMEAKDEV